MQLVEVRDQQAAEEAVGAAQSKRVRDSGRVVGNAEVILEPFGTSSRSETLLEEIAIDFPKPTSDPE